MGKKKEVFVDAFGEDGVELKKHKLKKDGFLKKLKNKIDEIFESDEDLSFFGKILMLSVYGAVSSIGLVIASTIGNVILQAIWAFTKLTAECPSFGAIAGMGWFVFILCFLAIVALMFSEVYIYSNSDYDDFHSIFTNYKKEDN